ncbi:MAG: flagellar hook protein FlgE [bacterium]|nr:flagellar hook protein FlgE [bacterium]
MTILGSLYSGVSGLSVNGNALSIIGDNIANVNTIGYKTSRASFSDVIAASLSGVSNSQVGQGTRLTSIDVQFTQGSFLNTTSPTDLSIDGKGFFVMRDDNGISYSRAGNFKFDKDGFLVNPNGIVVQGYSVDSNGNVTGSLGDINITGVSSAPNATSTVELDANLDSRSTTVGAAFDVTDPITTSNFSTAITVYDSLGNGHQVNAYFRKDAANTWSWYAVVGANDNANGTGDEIQAQGTMNFTTSGLLDSVSAVTYPTGGFDFTGGAVQDQIIDFDFGTPVTIGGSGGDGVTQYGLDSSATYQNQDGYASGDLRNYSVSNDGVITGNFSNGRTVAIAQLALATFQSNEGLTRIGGNLFLESSRSGQPIIGQPSSGGRGKISSNSLEQSTVDLAQEFVNMITSQRGFQANSRTITTTDELLQELINLKR